MKNIRKTLALILCLITVFSAVSLSASAVSKPPKPEMFTATEVTAGSVNLSWLPVNGAAGYRVYTYLDGKWKIVKDTKETSCNITGLHASKKYIFAVRSAVKVNGSNLFCDGYSRVDVRTKGLVATTLYGVPGVDRITLNWSKIDGASGYCVYQQQNDGKWKNLGVVSYKKNSATVKNLKSSTSYRFGIRAYSIGDGTNVIGPASNLITVKTLDRNKVTVSCAAVSSSAVKLNWTKAEDATGYRIFYYVNGGWKAVKTIMSRETLTQTFTKLTSDKNYYFRVRAFKKSGSSVKWFEPSDICKTTTTPSAKDIYVYRVDALRNIMQTSDFTLSYTTTDKKYGKIPVTLAKNGDSYYLSSRVNEFDYTLLNLDDGNFIVLDERKVYIKIPLILGGIFDVEYTVGDLLPDASWSNKASVETFDGQNVVCETFVNPSRTKTLKFFFKAGAFLGIEEFTNGSLQERVYVSKFTKTSDESIFAIPDDYSRIFYSEAENIADSLETIYQ